MRRSTVVLIVATNNILSYRGDPNRRLPGDHQVLDEDVVDPERVVRPEGVVLGIVHALDGVDVAQQDVVQPLDRHGRHLPDLGLVELVALGTKSFEQVSIL